MHAIIDACLRDFVQLNRPYKYLLTCVLTQKSGGAGLHSVATSYWDGTADFTCGVPWENEDMHCLVTVHAIALNLHHNEPSPAPLAAAEAPTAGLPPIQVA